MGTGSEFRGACPHFVRRRQGSICLKKVDFQDYRQDRSCLTEPDVIAHPQRRAFAECRSLTKVPLLDPGRSRKTGFATSVRCGHGPGDGPAGLVSVGEPTRRQDRGHVNGSACMLEVSPEDCGVVVIWRRSFIDASSQDCPKTIPEVERGHYSEWGRLGSAPYPMIFLTMSSPL